MSASTRSSQEKVVPATKAQSCSFGFGRGRRVRRHADYVRIQSASSGSERVSSRHFYFLIAPSPSPPSPDGRASSRPPSDFPGQPALARLGLIVTRKLGGAVVRNRIKRICRECFRRLAQDERWAAAGTDVVVIARAGAQNLTMTDALAEWEKLRPVIRKRSLQALAKASNKGHLSPPGQRS